MHVSGTVREAVTGRPVGGARVALQVGETHASTFTDGAGAFAWRTDRDHRGAALLVRVERTGFQAADTTRSVDAEEYTLDFELRRLRVSASLQVDVRDHEGGPVSGARVTATVGGASAVTNERGSALLTLDLPADPVSIVVRVEHEGFEPAEAEVRLPDPPPSVPVPVGIAIVREIPTDVPVSPGGLAWRRIIAAGIGGVLVAIPGTYLILRWVLDTGISSFGDLVALLLLVAPIFLLLAAVSAVGIVQVLVEKRRLAHGLIVFGLTPTSVVVTIIVLNAIF
jgi:hypothetical protein